MSRGLGDVYKRQYHKSTAPLKDYYGKQGKLVTVEGQDKVEDTSKLVLEAVKA